MKTNHIVLNIFLLISFLQASSLTFAAEPWYINSSVTVTTPMEVADVIVLGGGSLTVQSVPEPGFRITGNLIVIDDGTVEFRNSVIQILSTYHGQYALLAMGSGVIHIVGCEYRIPNQVQHAIIAWENGRVDIRDSNFGFAQFLASGQGMLIASQLNGSFECVIQDNGRMDLSNIPRDPNMGAIWVWPTFMPGSKATYSPPMPGFIETYSFPPFNASGIGQSFMISRCQVSLWPMLVREGSELTLKDISVDNWVVVGHHLPSSTNISGLMNGQTYGNVTLGFSDRVIRLQNASIDTWNLYPGNEAEIVVENSLVGEILASGDSSVVMRNTIVDGSGGYFGVTDRAVLEATDCTFTCDVQASREATAILRRSLVLPYPLDPTGAFTRFGAYDTARLHLDHTVAESTPFLGGKGAIALTWITDPPASPPLTGNPVVLHGYAGIYSLDFSTMLSSWTLKAEEIDDTPSSRLIGRGRNNIEDGILGRWLNAKPNTSYELNLTLKDRSGRVYTSQTLVPAQ